MKHSRPYRIGIDARFYHSSNTGISRYSKNLIANLQRLDSVNEYLVFLTPEGATEWEQFAPNFKPVVVDVPIFSVGEQTVLLKELRKATCDLVHFLNFNHPVLYTKPFVTTLHDLTLYMHPAGRSAKSPFRREIFKSMFRHAYRSAKKVVAISEYSAADAEKQLGVPHPKMEVILQGGPTPAELEFGSKARVQEYLQSRQPYFIFVSRWAVHKGILTLVEAFEKFKQQTGLPHALVLLGNQKVASETIRRAIATSPVTADIITPGFALDSMLPALYRHADAYVQPSEYEGLGLTVLEAFGYGVPVISTDNSSLPEVVGNAGLYFHTKDSDALAARLEQVARDENVRKDLIQKGYQQLSKFSWEKMGRQTHGLYMQVLEKME